MKTAVTEDEAKTMWCPDARVVATDKIGNVIPDGPAPFNRGSGTAQTLPLGTSCLGSKCMAWRWALDNWNQPTDEGYCGRAGMP